MKNKFASVLLITILLLNVLSFFPHINSVNPKDPIDEGITDLSVKTSATTARGLDYSVKSLGAGKFVWASEPRHIFDTSTQKYKPYIFKDLKWDNGYYQVSNAMIGARLFDYYTIFYDINFDKVKVYDERWEIQRYKSTGQGSWVDVGAQSGNAGWNIIQTPTYINLTKTFVSWAGRLEITYTVAEGQPFKHTVKFTSLLENEVFRVVQKWAGIVGNKVEYHIEGLNGVTSGYNKKNVSSTNIIEASYLTFKDASGNFVIGENQIDAIQWLEPIVVDVHANGMKADYVFSNWTLLKGEYLVIDPSTFTNSVPTTDFSACYNPTTAGYYKNNSTVLYFWKYASDTCTGEAAGAIVKYGVIEWDTTGISDSATISDTVFKYEGAANNAFNARGIYPMINKPSTSSAQTSYTDARDGVAYLADQLTFPVVAINQQIDLGASADTDLQALLGANWFAIGISHTAVTLNSGSAVWETSYASTPDPTLYVTYTVGNTVDLTFFAGDGVTEVPDMTDLYVNYENATNTYNVLLTSTNSTLHLTGQANGNIYFMTRAYNTTNTNSGLLTNSSNRLTFNYAGEATAIFLLSVYQSIGFSYQTNNGTAFTPSAMLITFGNNSTQASVTVAGGGIWVNGSNTIRSITWQNDNVKNATNTFTVSSDNQDLVFNGRIYTLRLQAVHKIGSVAISGNVHYNLTLANTTTITKLNTVNGIVGIFLQNDTTPLTVTAWWNGVKVNETITYVISGDNTSNVKLEVGRDLSDKTLFAEGISEGGALSLMVEGIDAVYQQAPSTWIMNSTTYTSGSWTGAGYYYAYNTTSNILNLTASILKPTTVIHTISIDTLARQVTFNATGSETKWVIAYAGVACAGTIRNIFLVDEITANNFPVGTDFNVNVTAFYSNTFLSVSQNDQSFTVCDEPLLVASLNSTSTNVRYFRQLIPSAINQYMYLPNIHVNEIELYTIQIVDLTNNYGGSTIRISMSGIEVDSGYLDSAFRYEVYLIDGFFFDVSLEALNGNTFTVGGLNANPADNNIVITITSIPMGSNRNIRSDNITWQSSWVGANIVTTFNNTLLDTTALNLKLYEQDFENKNYSIVFDNDYGATNSLTAVYAGNSSRGYFAKITYTSTSEGSISEQRPVTRTNLGFPSISIPASILGMDKIFPGVPEIWTYLISMFIVVGTALSFGALYSAKGAIIVAITGLFFTVAGWLPGTVAFGIAVVALAVLSNYTRERGD